MILESNLYYRRCCIYNGKGIREMIDDYKWIKDIIDSKVYDNESTSVAQYGYQSAMPKAEGTTSNRVLVKIINRNKALRKYDYLIKKIAFIDEYEGYIADEKDYRVLQMLKQRESHDRVMSIPDVGRDNFYSRIRDIVNILYSLQQETDTSYTSDSSDTSYKSYTSYKSCTSG